jgi:hypothetical protein
VGNKYIVSKSLSKKQDVKFRGVELIDASDIPGIYIREVLSDRFEQFAIISRVNEKDVEINFSAVLSRNVFDDRCLFDLSDTEDLREAYNRAIEQRGTLVFCVDGGAVAAYLEVFLWKVWCHDPKLAKIVRPVKKA